MRKRLIIIVVVACALSLCCVWFSCEKKEIEHNECANFSDSYTYTKKDQIEEVLKNNSEVIEKLVIGMKESKTNAIVLSGIDEYIKQNNQFVIDNEKALRDFYNNSKMDFLICFGVNNRCQVYQDTPPGKVVSLKLCGSIDKDNNFTWNVINTSSKDYLSLNIYNFLYNSD